MLSDIRAPPHKVTYDWKQFRKRYGLDWPENYGNSKELQECEKMVTKNPSDYKIENQSFERRPTGGIQEIAEKPFTVNHIESFTSKANEPIVIVETDETFDNIEYKDENDEKVRGKVNRFFASPLELRRFFSNPDVIRDVNENHNKIRTSIEKVPFTAEEIARKASLKGKTHYVFQGRKPKQESL